MVLFLFFGLFLRVFCFAFALWFFVCFVLVECPRTVTAQWIMYRPYSVLLLVHIVDIMMVPLHQFAEFAICNWLSGLLNDLARAIWRWTEKKPWVTSSGYRTANYGPYMWSKETLELFGKMTPHLWGPSKPAASGVSVHSGIPNSSGAVAINITESAVATRLLVTLR